MNRIITKISILIYIFVFMLTSCGNSSVLHRVDSEIDAYKRCTNNNEFKKWLFDSNMESLMVTDNGVTYSFTRTYDDRQKSVGLMIEIKDGCADYYIKNLCDSIANNIKTHLSNNSIVKNVYVEYTWICVDLKNENEFNNHD